MDYDYYERKLRESEANIRILFFTFVGMVAAMAVAFLLQIIIKGSL